MSFTQSDDGAARAKYVGSVDYSSDHEIDLRIEIRVLSTYADETVVEADAEAILTDLSAALSSSPFSNFTVTRTRSAQDAWTE